MAIFQYCELIENLCLRISQAGNLPHGAPLTLVLELALTAPPKATHMRSVSSEVIPYGSEWSTRIGHY